MLHAVLFLWAFHKKSKAGRKDRLLYRARSSIIDACGRPERHPMSMGTASDQHSQGTRWASARHPLGIGQG